MAKAKQPVNIEGIEFDALIDSENAFEAEVPSFPVEKGYEVSDGIILRPQKLSMTLLVGVSVTWRGRLSGGILRIPEVEARLKELYYKRKLITVVTSENIYRNMAIESISFNKSKEAGYTREIPINLKEVTVTHMQTAAIPASYGRSGATGENAGAASVTAASVPSEAADGEQNRSTILYNLANAAIKYFGGEGW